MGKGAPAESCWEGFQEEGSLMGTWGMGVQERPGLRE